MRKKKWLALLFLLSQTLMFSVNASGGQRMLTDGEEEYAYIGRHAGEILAGGSRKADGGETENGAPENTPASIWRRYACSELFEADTTDAREMEIGGRKEEPRGSAAEGRNTFPVYEFEKVAEASRCRDRSLLLYWEGGALSLPVMHLSENTRLALALAAALAVIFGGGRFLIRLRRPGSGRAERNEDRQKKESELRAEMRRKLLLGLGQGLLRGGYAAVGILYGKPQDT